MVSVGLHELELGVGDFNKTSRVCGFGGGRFSVVARHIFFTPGVTFFLVNDSVASNQHPGLNK